MTCVAGIVLCGALAALIVVCVLFARLPNVCDGADSLNRGEQRLCQPEAPVDVKVSRAREDVTAYRYATAELPATEVHTETFVYQEKLARYDYRYFNFALSAGGNVSWEYTFSDKASLYLMNVTQYRDFDKRSIRTNLWRKVDTLAASDTYTAAVAGVYYLAVENRHSRKVTAQERVTVTTARYRVDDAAHPPRESCPTGTKCVFRRVQPDETVIAAYTGSRQSVNVALHAGKGAFNTEVISPIVVCVVIIVMLGPYWLVLCIGCVMVAVEKAGEDKSGAPAPDAPAKTPDGGAKVAQPTADPVPLTPLGPTPGSAAYPATPYGTAAPAPENPDGLPPAYAAGTDASVYPATDAPGYSGNVYGVDPAAAPPADSGAPSGVEWKA